jgi:hypothetical protein
MRMDIENSPGAPVQRSNAPSRDNWGLAGRVQAGCDGRMTGKRVCSMRHFAPLRGERRFTEERMKGSLWRHSSFNLVEPRPSHRPRHEFPGIAPKNDKELASQSRRRNLRSRTNPSKFRWSPPAFP